MNRIWTSLGILLAFLVFVFGIVHLGEAFLLPMLAVSVILLGIGTLTGQ